MLNRADRLRPSFLLGIVAAIGLIINLGILTTSTAAPRRRSGRSTRPSRKTSRRY